MRTERNRIAEAFIRGIQIGADDPELAGDGDAMYAAFRQWADFTPREEEQPTPSQMDTEPIVELYQPRFN